MYDIVIWLQVYNIFNMYIYIHLHHIDSSLHMDIDVSRACCDIGNMDVAYAIATCCINTSKVHMCLELGTIIDIYIYRHWWACIFLVSTSVCSYDMDGK